MHLSVVGLGISGDWRSSCELLSELFLRCYMTNKDAYKRSDLQVCLPKGLTCCSRKMEERYQVAAKQNMESSLQASSTELKFLIIQNAALFQEAFDMVIRHARNYTNLMFRSNFRELVGEASNPVGELFTDMSLYILGSDTNVDDMVNSFFDNLFPLVYHRLLNPMKKGSRGPEFSMECLRTLWREVGAFGPFPKVIMTRLSHSLLATRVFVQALNLGIEIINTTDHLKFGKECGRALLKLWYCPGCQGLLLAKPCVGYCQLVMHACLNHVTEVHQYWQEYINGLGAVASGMQGIYDAENVLLKMYTLIRDAVLHANRNRLRLSTVVSNVCGNAPQRLVRSAHIPVTRPVEEPRRIKNAPIDPKETLSGRRREFIISLRSFSNFYSTLPETLCNHESVMQNNSYCWNGQEMTERFVSPGVKKPQIHNPEGKNKIPEPVVSQIIDKLKHINKVLVGSLAQYASVEYPWLSCQCFNIITSAG
ncbi:glypican-3 [Polypterus senegalus]|uniref:glypican-3 n=1 Tax=Polypterus senegalus TaxID=55291 RepID=UPI0019657658|nr:glypican-3 [Polypterus senegalus]